MNFSKVSVGTGAGFVANTMKPLCGVQLNSITKNVSSQAVVGSGLALYAGCPVSLKNKSDVSGNVLKITAIGTDKSTIHGFLLKSTNEVVEIGSEVGAVVEGQIASVAVFGSGVEVYLPCDATLQDVDTTTKMKWDTDKLVKDDAGTDALPITIAGGVIDAQKITNTAGAVTIANTKAIRVRL